MSETELAWAAGFFDGEGTFGVNRQNASPRYRYLTVAVPQKDVRPLQRFLAAVDETSRRIHKRGAGMHAVQWVGRPAERVAVLIEPYLSEPKREQLRRAREEVDAAQSRGRAVVS